MNRAMRRSNKEWIREDKRLRSPDAIKAAVSRDELARLIRAEELGRRFLAAMKRLPPGDTDTEDTPESRKAWLEAQRLSDEMKALSKGPHA